MMFARRLGGVAVLLFVAAACLAQPADVEVVYSGDEPQIVVWEEVTVDQDGAELIEGDVIRYEVFYRRYTTDEEVSLGEVVEPESTVDLSGMQRGYYYIGVRSVGETAEGAVEYSTIAWSNDPAAVDPTQPFAYIVRAILYPQVPRGLRHVP